MSSESTIGSVAIGWLLGVASGIAVDYFKRGGEAERFRDAVRVELNEGCITFAASFIQVQITNHRAKREDVKFCRELLHRYDIPVNRSEHIKHVDDVLILPDAHFKSLQDAMEKKNKEKAKNFQSLKLPYLSATPSLISLLRSEEQKSLVKILNYVERANSQINEIKFWVRELVSGKSTAPIESTYESGVDALMVTLSQILKEHEKLEELWKSWE